MAKMKLSKSTFTLIPEGVTTFKVMEVDDSKYSDFGKIAVKLQTVKGETHTERFSLIYSNGELNEGALRAWSYFARACLGNYQADEIDTQDIVGCYVTATVKHETFIRTKGDHAGEKGTSVRLEDYATATRFPKSAKNDDLPFKDDSADEAMNAPEDVDDNDLDDFLND
ncbi:MAG: hypothetical protein LUF85_06105 [Bacteroides sp.]|nr:hypothetical protein [Bacteroides sp.]